jgi:cytochrome c nitrite reductase small subunit
MQLHYDSWLWMGKHREKACVDCHLPNHHWASRLLRMGIDGSVGTAAFVSGTFPDPIRLSEEGRRTVQRNCVRCHAEMVSRIDAGRACWDCHRRSTHAGAARLVVR